MRGLAFAHLAAERPPPHPPAALWNDVLGPMAGEADALADGCQRRAIARLPAVLSADQSKAFERIALAWIVKVLRGWGLARWLMRAFMGLTAGRSVQAVHGGRLGDVHELLRSVGMGGTASMLIWNISYDPIVEGSHQAVQASTPTFADDLAGLATGPAQVCRLQIFLLVAGHAAGLAIETHECQILTIYHGPRTSAPHLRGIPLRSDRTASATTM